MKIRFVNYCFAGILTVIAATQGQTMHGTVSDALSKKPIAGAKVSFIGIAATWNSDSLGRFTSDTVKPGAYTVRVEAPGFLKATKKVVLSSPRETGTSNLTVDLSMYALPKSPEATDGSMVVQFSFPGHFPASIDIADPKGKVIRNAYDRSRTGGMRSYSWDGKDNNGKVVPAGRYSAQVVSGRLVMIRTLIWKGKAEARIKEK